MRPLEGIRVLDLTRFLAGPMLGRLLCDLGAEVVKVESPKGDPTRGIRQIKEGQSGYFVQQNCGKLGVCLDLRSEEGLADLLSLARKADVLVENFAPGIVESMGIGYESLKTVNGKLVMCSITGYGRTGPLATEIGADITAQAMSGIMYLTGHADRPPVRVGVAIGDTNAAMFGLSAILAALLRRATTGKGTYIDLSLVDSLITQHEFALQFWYTSDETVRLERQGAGHPTHCPYDVMEVQGRYLVVAVYDDACWDRLCALMGRNELSIDDRFSSMERRVENRPAVLEVVQEWLDHVGDRDLAVEALREIRLLTSPVLSADEASRHPQFASRDVTVEVPDPVLGTLRTTNNPFRFDGETIPPRGPAPQLGEHNELVFSRWLGDETVSTAGRRERYDGTA